MGGVSARRGRLGKRLNREDEEFNLRWIGELVSHGSRVEVVGGHEEWLHVHSPEYALACAAREVHDRLLEDRTSRCDHRKIADAHRCEVLDCSRSDVRFANAGSCIDNRFTRTLVI